MLMEGHELFGHELYDELVQCTKRLDPRLLESVNAQWAGLRTFAANGGIPDKDEWHRCGDDERIHVSG